MKILGFELCNPATVYVIISSVYLLVAFAIQLKMINLCILGMAGRGCDVGSSVASILGLGVELMFIALWAWILNYICKQGYTVVSWALVAMPFVYLVAITDVRMY